MPQKKLSFVGTLAVVLLVAALIGACDTVDPGPDENRVPLDQLVAEPANATLNPSGIAPLGAEVNLETKVPSEISYQVLGDEPYQWTVPGGDTTHEFSVLGLYPDTDNQVVVRIFAPEQGYALDTLTITTHPLPATFPTIDVEVAQRSLMEPGWTLSGFSLAAGGAWKTAPIVFDHSGDIRWYLDLSFLGGLVFPIRRFQNGNLMVARGHQVYELDMLGREVNYWEIPGHWQHHEILEKPDGNLILAVNKSGIETTDDHIIEINRTTGAVVNEWDMREILDVYRRDFLDNSTDWFHMNAIFYDREDDALIISGRNQAVVKVTMDNELVWILAPHKGWGPAGVNQDGHETSDYLLTAVDASGNAYSEAVQMGEESEFDFDWVWGQHAPLVLPNGNLFVFDNGINRNFGNADLYSRGVEYEINEDAMTVRQVWEYGSDRGEAFYSSIISDVDFLPTTGNRLIMPGTVTNAGQHAYVTEVTYPHKQVVFEAKINFKNLEGSGQGWGDMDIVYRSERLRLFPN